MGDSITPNTATPDVGVNPTPTPVPDSTPATVGRPDVEAITGTPNPADIPAPAGSDVAQAAPTNPASNGIKAGFSSAFPQFGPDANGNIVQSNPTPRNFKGILGSVLGGALRGAAFGMAAEKGESGAAAAQRLSDQAKLQAQTEAQRNLENQNALKRQKLQEALQTAEAVRSQKRLEMDKETHDALMQDHGVNSQILAAHLHDIKEGQANAESSWHAMMEAHGHAPLHGDVKNDNDTYVDTEGKLHTPGSDKTGETTPGVAGTSAGSVANLKGAGAKSAIAKLTTHAPNIANGNLMVTQNGELGQNSGFKLYENAKLDDVITKPAYFQTPTTMKHPDGTPVMQDHVIMPDGKTTFRTTREMLNGAEADVKAKTDQMIKTYELQTKALEPAKTAATTQKEKEEAFKAHQEGVAAAAGITGGASGLNNPLPATYKAPTLAEISADNRTGKQGYTVDQLDKLLQSAGVKVAPQHLGALLDVARYDADIKQFPTTHRKGVNDMTQQEAESIVQKYINPNFNTRDAANRLTITKELASGRGVGATRDRLNTAIQHMGDWSQAVQALPQNNLIVLNRIAGELGLQTGNAAIPVYNAIRDKLAAEQAGAIKGGSGSATDQEIDKAVAGMRYDLAPEQQSGVIKTQANLLKAAGNTLEDKFTDAFGGISPEQAGHSMYFRDNRGKLDALAGGAVGGAGNPNAPNGTPAALGANPSVPSGATGIAKGTDGKWYFHDISGRVLSEAPPQQ